MEIIIRGNDIDDFQNTKIQSKSFRRAVEQSVRRRLGLRPTDKVTLEIAYKI